MSNYFLQMAGLILVGLVIGGIMLYAKRHNKRRSNIGSYKLKTFITNNEKDCFFHLQKEFPHLIVCPQVSMGAILAPNAASLQDPNDLSVITTLRNKISSKIIDFVLLDKKTLEPVFIVELDDKSHDYKQVLDAERDNHLALAGIFSVRFRRVNGNFPDRKEIEKMLKTKQSFY